jgi:hypothetical protein
MGITLKQKVIKAIQARKDTCFTTNDIYNDLGGEKKGVNKATLSVTITRDLKKEGIIKPFETGPGGRAKSYIQANVTRKPKVKMVKTKPVETANIVDAAEFGEAIIQYLTDLKKKIAGLEFGFEDEARKHQAALTKKDDVIKEKNRDIERLNSQMVSSNDRIRELNEENERLARNAKRAKSSTFNLGELSHKKQKQEASPI